MHIGQVFFATAALALLGGCGGGTGPPTGPPAPVADTIRTIAGRLAYFPTGPALADFDANGRLLPEIGFRNSVVPVGAEFIPIEILGPTGALLAIGVTGTNGRFSIDVNFGKNPATQVVVKAIARLDLPFGSKARVLATPTATQPYSHQTAPGGNPNAAVMNVDLTIALDNGAAAYAILQSIRDAFVTAKLGITGTMPDLDVVWAPGNGDTSSFTALSADLGRLTIAGGIAGDPSSNVDAWDPPRILRLFGLYLLEYFFNETAPDGDPSDAPLVPSMAWREGFLDFWACIARGSPVFWDTEGLGSDGRVVRYFNIESFFDTSLGSLGPNDPNVYQDPAVIGVGSAFTVAELLWDIHDVKSLTSGDRDGVEFPLFLTLRFLAQARPGFSYPYLYTLLDAYARDGSLSPVTIDILMRSPENQGLSFPATLSNGFLWPPQIAPDNNPQGPIAPPFDKTVSDLLDTLTPDPINVEVGLQSQRYFLVDLILRSDLTASLTTTGNLLIDIMDQRNNVLASGPSPLTATGLEPLRYIIRVRSAADPQRAPFDLRVQVTASP